MTKQYKTNIYCTGWNWGLLTSGDTPRAMESSAIPDVESSLRERFGSEFKNAVIGPAGERQVLYATISHDRRHAGRGGSGAVLGAKNVKAIVVAA